MMRNSTSLQKYAHSSSWNDPEAILAAPLLFTHWELTFSVHQKMSKKSIMQLFKTKPTPVGKNMMMICIIDLEVSWTGGTPSHHPFLDGIFPNKNHPFWIPPWLWKPPRHLDAKDSAWKQRQERLGFCGFFGGGNLKSHEIQGKSLENPVKLLHHGETPMKNVPFSGHYFTPIWSVWDI